MSISVAQLHSSLSANKDAEKILCSGVAINSEAVETGFVFVALAGATVHGGVFADEAINRGAVAILSDGKINLSAVSVPVFVINDLAITLSEIATNFYGNASINLPVFAVTGTNGKTTVTQLIAQLLAHCGLPSGVIGTLGWGPLGVTQSTGMTTPDILTTYKMLHSLQTEGVKSVAMEVSSHALVQKRVEGLVFNTVVFTNLSRDHLDYHQDMACYQKAKESLFTRSNITNAIINIDDVAGQQIAKNIAPDVKLFTCSTQSAEADISVCHLEYHGQGIRGHIVTPWGEGELDTPLLGQFNVMNLLQAISVVALQGYSLDVILSKASELKAVAGRMELLAGNDVTVIVDYAHTPDALEKVLVAARHHTQGQLICVFGCGGNRDKGKRPLMGAIACQYADRVVVTSDNPRLEDPQSIINDIVINLAENEENLSIKVNRREAIRSAIINASAGDCVVVAGKGHEKTQEIMGELLPFNDYLESQAALHLRGAA